MRNDYRNAFNRDVGTIVTNRVTPRSRSVIQAAPPAAWMPCAIAKPIVEHRLVALAIIST
jgi:hypothetical protein